MPADPQKAREIFLHAVGKLPAGQWERYVAAASGGDAELAELVGHYLNVHREAGSFLDRPAAGIGPTGAFAPDPAAEEIAIPPQERPGTIIGPYKLLQQIGEGGMGTVYMAEQTAPVQRKVAIKLIKPGMVSHQVVARFEAERQALAIMDHVNIARVFDGGSTETGRPYFVMELVHGVPITKYCDNNRLTPRQRLELFVPVCQAIQHAHQKGIIHRDIKPSNVMVTLYDGKPVPKVIDFGVAKATEKNLTERTLFTQCGTVVGTLEYMSPEQAEMSALGVDTRSDIFSLGVLLYELLTGNTPLSHKTMKEAAYGEILRMIREEEAPKPSTRLSDPGEALASISAQRHTESAKLSKLMRGELDWIVMKSLEKDRNRRYETAKDFAADVQRYLHDETVQACPPTIGYRLRKLYRRYKRPMLAASFLMLTLVGGIIGTTVSTIRATNSEAKAVNESHQKAEALAKAQDELFNALVNRARAQRSSGRIGQRFESLKVIRDAAKIRVTPELRTEAIAALVLPDAEIAQEWERSTNHVTGEAFDTSFQNYARFDKDGGVLVCRLRQGQEEVVTRLPGSDIAPCLRLSMSADARFVVGSFGTNNKIGKVWVWQIDGLVPTILVKDESPGYYEGALAFHPDSLRLAISHSDETKHSVRIYDLATGQRLRQLKIDGLPIQMAFHPSEYRLAVACGGTVQLFDTNTGQELPRLRPIAPVTNTISLSWHHDGRRLAAGCNDRKIHIWDTQSATEIMTPWVGHTIDGMQLTFNRTGDMLASVDWSGQTRLWDTASGRTLLTLPNFWPQTTWDDSRSGPHYSSGKISLWRVVGGKELRVLRPRRAGVLDNIRRPVVHADGRTLAATTGNELCFFDMVNGEELAAVRMPEYDAAEPMYTDPPYPKPDQQLDRLHGWITGGRSGIYSWPTQQDAAHPEVMRIGPPEQIMPDSGGGFSSGASASADGRVVAVPQGDSTLLVCLDQPKRRVVLEPQHDVRFSTVSSDGHWVVTCSWGSDGLSKTIRVWDANTGKPVQDLSSNAYTSAIFSPDGRWLMTTDIIKGTRQFEVGTWREVRHFDRCKYAFSSDSKLLAVNDVLSVIRLIETTTGREVARLTGPDPTWYSPTGFTPDGTRLIATNAGETAIFVWDLRLIRKQLQELGLDWEWPDFPPADAENSAAKPRRVEVLVGELGLTPELISRREIEKYRPVVLAEPNNASACNALAWAYSTGPASLRELKAAMPLAENAVRLMPQNAVYRNTLGVVYYRVGKYREAVEALQANLESQEDWGLAIDLYFLAMSHHRLGETARARVNLTLAIRWTMAHHDIGQEAAEELKRFRKEAEALMGVEKK